MSEAGIAAGTAAGAMVQGATEEVVNLIKQAARYGVLRHTPLGTELAKIIADVAYGLQDAGAIEDPFAISPEQSGVLEFMRRVWADTALLTLAVSEDAAEVITEAASEALSNASYSGFAGLIDAVIRARVGGVPPQSPVPLSVRASTRAWIDALTGTMFHPLVVSRLAEAADETAKDLLSDEFVQRTLDAHRWYTDTFAMWLTMYGELMRAALMRALESVAAVLEALFARLEDVASEYYAAKILYDAGQLPENEWLAVQARVQAELQAIEAEIDAVLEDCDLSQASPTPPDGVSTLVNMVTAAVKDAMKGVAYGFSDYVTTLSKLRVRGRPTVRRYALRVGGEIEVAYDKSEG